MLIEIRYAMLKKPVFLIPTCKSRIFDKCTTPLSSIDREYMKNISIK